MNHLRRVTLGFKINFLLYLFVFHSPFSNYFLRSCWNLHILKHRNHPVDLSCFFGLVFKKTGLEKLKEHRFYFSQENRGFGEDAFHAFWMELFRLHRPTRMLEIGVYQGQTVTLWRLISDLLGIDSEIWGITPLSDSGDAHSQYPKINYAEAISRHLTLFSLKPIKILKCLSTAPDAKALICGQDDVASWDLIYIDGSHDYEIVLQDYQNAIKGLKRSGLLVLDDSSLHLAFKEGFYGKFKGHPGPSRVSKEIAFQELRYQGSISHLNIFQK